MKKRLFLVGLVLVLGFAFIGPSTSLAADPFWATVTITKIGMYSNDCAYAILSHDSTTPAFTDKFFFFRQDLSKPMLATALTGLSLEKKLYIHVDSNNKIDTLVVEN